MNDKKIAGDLSLSLVDVVTNGLASVLVLFFLLALLRAQMSWSNSSDATSSQSLEAIDPLLVIVSDESNGNNLFSTDSPWITPLDEPGIIRTHGKNYATLYATQLPLATIELALPPGNPSCRIQVFHGKNHWEPLIGDQATVRVWPQTPPLEQVEE